MVCFSKDFSFWSFAAVCCIPDCEGRRRGERKCFICVSESVSEGMCQREKDCRDKYKKEQGKEQWEHAATQ